MVSIGKIKISCTGKDCNWTHIYSADKRRTAQNAHAQHKHKFHQNDPDRGNIKNVIANVSEDSSVIEPTVVSSHRDITPSIPPVLNASIEITLPSLTSIDFSMPVDNTACPKKFFEGINFYNNPMQETFTTKDNKTVSPDTVGQDMHGHLFFKDPDAKAEPITDPDLQKLGVKNEVYDYRQLFQRANTLSAS